MPYEAREAIADGYKRFEDAFRMGDADAIGEMYTHDAALLIPKSPNHQRQSGDHAGLENHRWAWRQCHRRGMGEVQETGDWAYEVGAFTASAPDGQILNAGKYIVIWRRGPAGWKIHPAFQRQ